MQKFRICAAIIGGMTWTSSQATELYREISVWHPGHPGLYFGTPNCATPMQLSFKICLPEGEQVDLKVSSIHDVERQGLPQGSDLNRELGALNCAVAVVRALPDHSGTAPYYSCMSLGWVRAEVHLVGVQPAIGQKRRLR